MLLLMIGTTVQGESRISRSSFQTANFAEPMQRRNLNGRVIQEPVVDSMTSCQLNAWRMSDASLTTLDRTPLGRGLNVN